MAQKYNYDAALELLEKAYNLGETVPYEQLQLTLGLERPIGDREAGSTNNSILYELRNRLKEKTGLTFKSNAGGANSTEDKQFYTISKADAKTIKTAKKSKPADDDREMAMSALQKSNQKLFLELEEMKEKYGVLEQRCRELQCREQNLKTLIKSYHELTMA